MWLKITLTIAAAADLSPLESDLASSFGKSHPAIHLRFVTESSAALAQQIENGAPYDIFLSANAAFVDRLALNRKIQPESVLNYTEGRLGLLWRDGKKHPLKELSADWVHFLALPESEIGSLWSGRPGGDRARRNLAVRSAKGSLWRERASGPSALYER